jgi:hypothetical protein
MAVGLFCKVFYRCFGLFLPAVLAVLAGLKRAARYWPAGYTGRSFYWSLRNAY